MIKMKFESYTLKVNGAFGPEGYGLLAQAGCVR